MPIWNSYWIICCLYVTVEANLLALLEHTRIPDLNRWNRVVGESKIARFYMDDIQARITVFAPVDDVFVRNESFINSMTEAETLMHFADVPIRELGGGKRWSRQLLVVSTVQTGKLYITLWENNPMNFSYFANNGRICNHVTPNWSLVSGNQWLFKICSSIGHVSYDGTALSLVEEGRMLQRLQPPNEHDLYWGNRKMPSQQTCCKNKPPENDTTLSRSFHGKRYNNADLTSLLEAFRMFPLEANLLFGDAHSGHLHTFFLPNNDAFNKISDRQYQITRESIMAHVTANKHVLFVEPWLYDYGLHKYPSVTVDQFGKLQGNMDVRLWLRNITNGKTGRYQIYAVSDIYRRPYITHQYGFVWAKIVQPNIPVTNGVAHVIDSVLSVVTQTIEEILAREERVKTLFDYLNTIGQIVKSFLSTKSGVVTFFAPLEEAFTLMPEQVERRVLRDRIWLEQILKLHLVPSVHLTTARITNLTVANTADNQRQLRFVKAPSFSSSASCGCQVIGGGIKANIIQEDVAAINGIVHFIDRVLGLPYLTIYIALSETPSLKITHELLSKSILRYTLDPHEVVRPESNFTFFVPSNDAWHRQSSQLKKLIQSDDWTAKDHILKRHLLQGQALRWVDLREKTFVMLNGEKLTIRLARPQNPSAYPQGITPTFQLHWSNNGGKTTVVGELEPGGEIACTNGFIHIINNALITNDEQTSFYNNAVISRTLSVFMLVSLVVQLVFLQSLSRS